MVFSSLSFLFLCLPVLTATYYLLPGRTWRNGVLLLFSLMFYAWGEPILIAVMLLSTAIAYISGIKMHDYREAGSEKTAALLFSGSTVLILLFLAVFKYLDFFLQTANAVFGCSIPLPGLRLPIGISFYTFQILSYLFDLHRKKVSVQRNYLKLLLYVCLFPQLIAGPIVRYSMVETELTERTEDQTEALHGIRRFIVGLSKKVLIANGVAQIAEIVYTGDPNNYGTSMYWLAALAYTLQIYFDFSGYSDMAIGLGLIFGFHFPENFEHPYMALSITDFWRRWHISLSSWFRDYVYIPLGGNRVSSLRQVLNLLIVWALTGLWHGASWNFMLWGLYYGVFIILEKNLFSSRLERIPKGVRWLFVFGIVNIGWVIFNRTDFSQMWFALHRMFSFSRTDFVKMAASNTGILEGLLYLPFALLCCFPIGAWIKNNLKIDGLIENAWCCILFVLCVVWICSNHYNPFIYFRF